MGKPVGFCDREQLVRSGLLDVSPMRIVGDDLALYTEQQIREAVERVRPRKRLVDGYESFRIYSRALDALLHELLEGE